MGVLTIHHWTDRARGLAELRRVARDRIVLFMRDPEACPWWWLYAYCPATERLVKDRETRLADLAAVIGRLETIPVPIPADCRDGFEAAFWRRPQAYLDPEARRAMSALALSPKPTARRACRRYGPTSRPGPGRADGVSCWNARGSISAIGS